MNEEKIIEIYDRVVGSRKDFRDMLRIMSQLVKGDVLEIGAGTGLLTEELIKNKKIKSLTAIEPNTIFIKKFKEKQNLKKLKLIQADGLNYRHKTLVDFVVMSTVYHHIKDEEKEKFLENLFKNIKIGSRLIIGDVFILPYRDEKERNISLKIFHKKRTEGASTKVEKDVEREALDDGLKRDGEYKVSCNFLKRQLKKLGCKKIKTIDVGSQKFGGYKIVLSRK